MAKIHTRQTLTNDTDEVIKVDDIETLLTGLYKHSNEYRSTITLLRRLLDKGKKEPKG